MNVNKTNWILSTPEQFEVFINSNEKKLVDIVDGFEATIKAMLHLLPPETRPKCVTLLQNLAKHVDNIYDEHEKRLSEIGIKEAPIADQGGTSQQQEPKKIQVINLGDDDGK